MVRSQQLEIWFGQLGLIDGSEEVVREPEFLEGVLVSSLKVD